MLEHNKRGDIPEYINQLLKLNSHDDFEALVDEWRKKGMHNDDTTLVVVEPDNSDDFSIDTNSLDNINKLIDEEKKLIEEKKKEEETEQISEENPKSISDEQMKLPRPSDFSDNELKKNEVVIDYHQEILPVEEEVFRVDFLREYKIALESKVPVLKNLKFKCTQKAISEAIKVMYEKYSINIK